MAIHLDTGLPREYARNDEIVNKSFLEKLIAWFTKAVLKEKQTKAITVGDTTYEVEVASSSLDQQIGLSKHQKLESNQGMTFPYKDSGQKIFWMKDMKFDIDIVWIYDKKVVGVSQGYYSNPYKLIYSPQKVDLVLEVNPKSDLKIGDKVIY